MDITPVAGAESLDPQVRALQARLSSSISLEALLLAFTDWAAHLASSPGKRMDLARLALTHAEQLDRYLHECLISCAGTAHACVEPSVTDRRFTAEEWQQWPFNLLHQSFLLHQQWWNDATHGVSGVSRHHEDVTAFAVRQWLDVFSPGNLLPTNPVVLNRTLEEGGANLIRGASNWLDDLIRQFTGAPPAGTEAFVVGRDVGVTPGKVVFRNHLIELIQYAPTTAKVHPEPVLAVPAWIMKYYILDLSPHNSLIRYLLDQGHTVFCISWKNPDADDRHLSMDDYLNLGVDAALTAIGAIIPGRQVHGVGYCLGGTLLAIAAATMARDGEQRLATMTLLAAQTDFAEPGELALFVDESQISLLEAQMQQTGYLTAAQMTGTFQMLRSNDLLWSRLINEYLLGERRPMSDLMAWNADTTRMPARMHSQYLRRLYLENELSNGRYPVKDKPVELNDIDVPVFSVGTSTDHVAPWRSVYMIHNQIVGDVTFVLTSGGHNAGIVSEPGHPNRRYQILTRAAHTPSLAVDDWLQQAPQREGSWWPEWVAWLQAHSGTPTAPPRIGAANKGFKPIDDAPGRYVLAR